MPRAKQLPRFQLSWAGRLFLMLKTRICLNPNASRGFRAASTPEHLGKNSLSCQALG